MKRHIFVLSAAAGLAVFSASALAAAQPTNAQLISEIHKISQETAALQGEVRSLKAQLRRKSSRNQYRKRSRRRAANVHYVNGHEGYPVPISHIVPTHPLYRPIVTVTTSPWMGLSTHFRPMDLLERQGSMNEDLYLLQRKQHFIHELEAAGYHLDRPMVQLSGGVEGQAVWLSPGSSTINLSTVELDVNAVASNWANAFFTFDYDNSPVATGNREPNGRIFLQRGFLTIGDLDRSPLYFTIGQMYVPFGKYSSAMVTTPLNESLARILTRTALLGISYHGFYAQGYAYTGDRIFNTDNIFEQGGFNVGIDHSFSRAELDIGVGGVSNMADSQGMQNNGLNMTGFFNGFDMPVVFNGVTTLNMDNLRRNVPAGDAHAELTIKPFTFIGEYQAATRTFNLLDMTYNNGFAKPKSLHTEIDYDFQIYWAHFTLFGAYDKTWQSFALNLPRQSYAVGLWTSLWKDTSEGIEYRHNTAYPNGTVATGGSVNGIPVPVPVSNGQASNIVTAQIGVYF